MNDDSKPTSGKTATAEVDPQAKAHEDRSTTAGLGMFDRVNNLTGAAPIGVSQGIGGATVQEVTIGTNPGIAGVDRISATGAPGTDSLPTRFTQEDDHYWRQNYGNRHYANPASNYEEYRPAYQYGTDAAHRYQGRKWDDVQGDLERGWNETRGGSGRAWHDAKDAVRDAWHRVERALPGDADHDGR
jgi:hypothetical protein